VDPDAVGVPSLRKFSANEADQERLKILEFYAEHGEAQTLKFFHVNRKAIHVWKQKLERSGHRLESLIPRSTRPKQVRRMITDPRIVAFLRELRENRPRLGKEKIKPLLDEYCLALGIPSLAVSTIGKVIHRHRLSFPKRGRVYHDPGSKQAQNQGKRHAPRNRVRYAPHPEELGHWQMDTLVRTLDGLRVYFYSAIDVKGKIAFSLPYSRLSSRNAKDFLENLRAVYPLAIRDVQTDNGSEFQGELDDYLQSQKIPHLWTYPRCPRINGCVERYQRSLSEEFIEVHEDSIREPRAFLQHLGEYLVFYNRRRIHEGIGKQTPMSYLLSQRRMSKMLGCGCDGAHRVLSSVMLSQRGR
jgi:transposase InsO family protein